MTPQEVINIIEDVTWQDNGRHYGKIAHAREIAISALEKQTQKKPILDTIFPSGVKWWRCPVCNKIIVGCIANRPQKYCANCGQALKWSDN